MPAIEPVKPRIVSSTVDARDRPKDFLTPEEVERLVAATKGSRYPLRDRAMLLVMYHHGLRVSELVGLRVANVDLLTSRLWIRRAKGGLDTEHPIMGAELRAIKRYLATRQDSLPWLFISERGAPFARMSIYKMIQHTAARAGLPNVHPHTLRHSCGYYLANKGCDLRLIGDYLGHRSVQSTMRYTRTAASRFEGLWR